ncbi:MAG: 16S rRNA (cytidine(1402)-2'-O)-methyltransferase [Acidobacteria bacterium]|nr:16S rRNA (cytidine(1402)-2'-O)-methyltransferase [Acidobacteriota bacterium]
MSAVLYVVATPIGNLEDITFRAVRILKEADIIACEDTRHTRKLLDHYGVSTPMVSYHEHNETARAGEIVERLRAGESVALVSDAGTPLVSDPGYRVVAAAAEAGFAVTPLPGACASIAALCASGLPTDSFRFCGFLPHKPGQRRKAIEAVSAETATLVFYEAPHRIVEAVEELRGVLGNRNAVLAREITKIHEEFLRGRLDELASRLGERESAAKGEFTILIAKADEPAATDEPVAAAVKRLERTGVSRMEAMKQVARERGLSKREVYSAVEQGK